MADQWNEITFQGMLRWLRANNDEKYSALRQNETINARIVELIKYDIE